MRLNSRAAAVGAAVAAIVLSGTAVANATIGDSAAAGRTTARQAPAKAAKAAAPRPCTTDDVSFYFGGYTASLSRRSFDLTLLAHDGVVCTLKDTPLITVKGSPDEDKPIPVTVNGRGGTLVLRPDSPLHTTAIYNIPDAAEHTLKVSSMTLSMPDHSSRGTYFYTPGVSEIYQAGVSFTSWTTGLGLGQGEEAY
ncbi:hypothetical protein ACFRDV_20155 [Streptomyces fagopyri]|uniref:DUF4232 domain-containing protein n=1 Tax=Streptomyces fagopyri TaxID=2662397 RepID=A0A5Q0L5H4_9ACTN|nr:hypothetical protein [Streptomyces fagopyri]QFZ72305.1 hypothetical protein GFH48_02655 [Streptomyces fagopyri]